MTAWPGRWRLGGTESRPLTTEVTLNVGFRSIEIRQGRLLLNGSELTIRGVNRHEHDPTRGHVVDRDSMIKEPSIA